QKQLAELNVNDKVQTGEIKIKLNASTATTLDIIIKYNVINAGWFPIYDLKADKINAPLQLAYKAHVYQSTGKKWENVKLTLSTSDPNTNNLKPEVNTKHLNFISHNTYYNNNATKSYNYKYNPMVQTVSGIVTANDGSPLPGVNVIEKGTTNGVQTDFDGNYTLKISTGNELVYSFIGMKSESLPIHSSIMNVSLDEDVAMLDEVVVMAYGSQKRTAMTSSVTEVKSESIDRLLQGKVAGVQIRGMANIKSKDNPLYVVDGNILNGYEVGNLNPDDIMSVDILKDATSAALYGNRANNGVVVITTKKGEYTSKGDVIEQGITNTRFEIKKPYTIPSDGDVTVIEIENYSVPATYAYFAAPVLNENVFLTAKIGNWEQYNLLPAEANVYFEGSYSGKTNINPMATTDSLTVSLGVDPNVVIKRTELNDFKKNQYIGSNKIINKKYELELKNNKQTNIDLVLFDRIPISQNRDIKVEDIETGNANYDSEKGIMEWKVNLKPNDKSTYSFSYSIKYPKYKRVNL
ncbi:MAG: mucoidy inhibitor MuiA family protein, partial [Gelidibacter sp.]|nr:mucoidy inhibitor MuiA family protein [Gelidibacter sp.]